MTALPPPPPGALMTLLPPPGGDTTGPIPLPTLPKLATAPRAVESPHTAEHALVVRDDPSLGVSGAVPRVRTDATTPRGFVASTVMRPMRSTAVHALPMLALYTVTVGCVTTLALLAVRADDLTSRAGATSTQLAQLEQRSKVLMIVLVAAAFGGAVLTSLWAGRVVVNARSMGIPAQLGPARVAWFVPIWTWFGGFREVAKTPGAARAVGVWQFVFVAQAVVSIGLQVVAQAMAGPDARIGSWAEGLAHARIVLIGNAGLYAAMLGAAATAVAVIARNTREIELARRELTASATA